MTTELASIGEPPWTRAQLRDALERFATLYAERPIAHNAGGMRAPHMFATWFALEQLRPTAIVESGLWRGQGTWLFEHTCPEAELHCIDIDLSRLEYRSPRATYYEHDFSQGDWSALPRESTLLFFDDHQDAVARVRHARELGFRHLMFEDNYPAACGDCYSLKKAFAGAGFTPQTRGLSRIARLLGKQPKGAIAPNLDDAAFLRETLSVYFEFPPPYKPATTRWGDPWNDAYPTPEPLLGDGEGPAVFHEEARDYTWICYAQLRG